MGWFQSPSTTLNYNLSDSSQYSKLLIIENESFTIFIKSSLALSVEPDEILSDINLEKRAKIIGEQLRCLVCQNEDIQNSNADVAKDLRKLVDNGKKELTEGVIVIFAIKDEKIGLAIGVTENLIKKYDAVKLVKIGSEIIGGKGGGDDGGGDGCWNGSCGGLWGGKGGPG